MQKYTFLSIAAGLVAVLPLGCVTQSGVIQSRPERNVYYVDGLAENTADDNPGTEAAPWKTLGRAGSAEELKPGDVVRIKSGVYRESMLIRVSGEPGRPIVFEAAPHAKVVIKGSELLRGSWTKMTREEGVAEPYPGATRNIWKTKLNDTHLPKPTKPSVAQVILGDTQPMFPVGPGSKKTTGEGGKWVVVEPVGRGAQDVRNGTYFFDPETRELYTKVSGAPSWYSIEISVRKNVIRVVDAHDVVLRGIEARHAAGRLAGMTNSKRIVFEDCRFTLASFCNLNLTRCTDCVVRGCDLSWGGNTGLTLSLTRDCVIEDCSVMFNNYLGYGAGWHDGGMKNIPGNKRTTVRRCEVAYNSSDGIWFDMLNVDTRILDNVVHHNRKDGIHLEVNYGPGVVAGNLCYANGYGINVVGHPSLNLIRRVEKGEMGDPNERRFVPKELKDWLDFPDETLWIVHNTVVENHTGIATSHNTGTSEFGQTRRLAHVHVLNNLFIRNGQAEDIQTGKYVDLRFWMHLDKDGKRAPGKNCHSDYNVFAAGVKTMLKPHYHYTKWGTTRDLAEWQELFGEDRHSRIVPVEFQYSRRGFRLLSAEGLDVATPLPDSVTEIWRPERPRLVGSGYCVWPDASVVFGRSSSSP